MNTRHEMRAGNASVAAALAGLGLLPGAAQAARSQAAFDTRNMGDLMKALGTSGPVESRDVTNTGPDIAENGAVVPVGAATTLAGVRGLRLLVEKCGLAAVVSFPVTASTARYLAFRPGRRGPCFDERWRGSNSPVGHARWERTNGSSG